MIETDAQDDALRKIQRFRGIFFPGDGEKIFGCRDERILLQAESGFVSLQLFPFGEVFKPLNLEPVCRQWSEQPKDSQNLRFFVLEMRF